MVPKILAICILVFEPVVSLTELDTQWMMVDDIKPTQVHCIGNPKYVKDLEFKKRDQTTPFVIKSPKFNSQDSYDQSEKCKARIFVPPQSDVFLYFSTFNVIQENDNCGDYLLLNKGRKAMRFCGSKWEGKLIRLSARSRGYWLRFFFSSNANMKTGKGFEIHVFGKYANQQLPATAPTTTTTTITTSTTTTTTTTSTTTTTDTPPSPLNIHRTGKIMIFGGESDNGYSQAFQLIDLANPSNVCQGIPDFPSVVLATSMSLIETPSGDVVPLLIGGFSEFGAPLPNCYLVDQTDTPFATLSQPRGFSASMPLNSTSILVVGGSDGNGFLNSSEIISADGSTSRGPDILQVGGLSGHCLVRIDETRAILIGGLDSENLIYHTKTRFLDIPTLTWTDGPTMQTGRASQACSTYQSNGKTFVIVTGGVIEGDATSSLTEILDVSLPGQVWVPGPDLPTALYLLGMVRAPEDNAVIVMGGFNLENTVASQEFLKLTCDDTNCGNWVTMGINLPVASYSFAVANIATC